MQRNRIVLFGIGDKGEVLRVRGEGGALGVRSRANELTPARGVTCIVIRVFVVKGIGIRETTRLLWAAKGEAQRRRGRGRGRGCHLFGVERRRDDGRGASKAHEDDAAGDEVLQG